MYSGFTFELNNFAVINCYFQRTGFDGGRTLMVGMSDFCAYLRRLKVSNVPTVPDIYEQLFCHIMTL